MIRLLDFISPLFRTGWFLIQVLRIDQIQLIDYFDIVEISWFRLYSDRNQNFLINFRTVIFCSADKELTFSPVDNYLEYLANKSFIQFCRNILLNLHYFCNS